MWSYAEYYQTNKDRISRKRKLKYRRNKDFRKDVRLKAHDYYHRVKKGEHIADRHIVSGEEGERLYTIGRLSSLIRRSVVAIRRYHRVGIIPEPTFFDSRGWRLYKSSQASLLQSVFRKIDTKELKNLGEARDEIYLKWR